MRTLNLKHPFRYGLSLLLLLMFALILASTFWERFYIKSMTDSCASMYTDRLMVATALFHIGDNVNSKLLLLEEHFESEQPNDQANIHYRLGELDGAIQNILMGVERTSLVEAESQLLEKLRVDLKNYQEVEQRLLAKHASGEDVHHHDLRNAFTTLRAELLGLTKIQENVGKELSNESVTAAAGASSLTHFQLGVAFILGLLSSGLAVSIQAVSRKSAETTPSADLH